MERADNDALSFANFRELWIFSKKSIAWMNHITPQLQGGAYYFVHSQMAITCSQSSYVLGFVRNFT